MASEEIRIDIEGILGGKHPEFIPIDKCVTSQAQMRQTNTAVNEKDKIVDQIRKIGGLLHPIIVKKQDDGNYEVIVGQRRTNAHYILKKEDPKYNMIKAYVIDRDLDEDEKRVISFVENFGKDDPSKSDYINVIEYFYMKFNCNMSMASKALGITPVTGKKYLTHARLSDKVKEHITNKDFTIDTAITALKGLGDDEGSVDEDQLIETAKLLQTQKPDVRTTAAKKMQKNSMDAKAAIELSQKTSIIKLELADHGVGRLDHYMQKHDYESRETAALGAMNAEFDRDLSNGED